MAITTVLAHLLSSGKAIKIHLLDGSGNYATPSSVTTIPTVNVGGVNAGSLVNGWVTGYHTGLIYCLPTGVQATSSSVVVLNAPTGWCSTDLGSAPALTDQPVTNYAGKSAYRDSSYTPTLKIGFNMPHWGTKNSTLYNPFKNWRRRITYNSFGAGAVCGPDGKPTKLGSTGAGTFSNMNESNVLDSTCYPDPAGYWAVKFNDSGNNPASLTTAQAANCTITELTDRRNNGTGGNGQVRVYQVTRKANYTSANLGLQVVLGPSGGAPTVDPMSLEIIGPGDFTLAAPNTPQTIDTSDPYAVSPTFQDRVANPSVLRWMDSTGIGATQLQSIMSEPEDMRPISAFSWGNDTYVSTRTIPLAQVRPYTIGTSPYVYCPYMGTAYSATLGANITTTPAALTQEVITVTDAATAPVFAGQVLAIDSEKMRVLSVSGTSVTVERGSQGTTPATHTAGAISVQYRIDKGSVSWLSGSTNHPYWEVVTSTPHGIRTGIGPQATVSGTYANLTLNDTTSFSLASAIGTSDTVLTLNTTVAAGGWSLPVGIFIKFDSEDMKVTAVNAGANQITVARAQNSTTAASHAQGAVGTTHTSSVLLGNGTLAGLGMITPYWVTSPTSFVVQTFVNGSGSQTAAFAQDFDPASYYLTWTTPDEAGIPYGAAAKITAQFPGCDFYANVPPGATNDFVWAMAREIRDNFPAGRKVWVEWSNETWNTMYSSNIWTIGNSQLLFNSGQPYKYTARRHTECHDIFVAAFNEGGRNRGGEIKRVMASQYFGTGVTNGVLGQALSDGKTIDALAISPYFTTDNTATAQFDACDNEQAIDYHVFNIWYNQNPGNQNTQGFNAQATAQQTAIANHISGGGNPAIELVTYEGGYQAPLPASCANYIARSRDIAYNPNWYIAEQDLYAWMQLKGFTHFCLYAYSMNYNTSGRSPWGLFHGDQDYGRGDGSDGKLNNLLCLATPNLPTSKAATTSLEVNTVSVRDQAYRDWNATTNPQSGPASDPMTYNFNQWYRGTAVSGAAASASTTFDNWYRGSTGTSAPASSLTAPTTTVRRLKFIPSFYSHSRRRHR